MKKIPILVTIKINFNYQTSLRGSAIESPAIIYPSILSSSCTNWISKTNLAPFSKNLNKYLGVAYTHWKNYHFNIPLGSHKLSAQKTLKVTMCQKEINISLLLCADLRKKCKLMLVRKMSWKIIKAGSRHTLNYSFYRAEFKKFYDCKIKVINFAFSHLAWQSSQFNIPLFFLWSSISSRWLYKFTQLIVCEMVFTVPFWYFTF